MSSVVVFMISEGKCDGINVFKHFEVGTVYSGIYTAVWLATEMRHRNICHTPHICIGSQA